MSESKKPTQKPNEAAAEGSAPAGPTVPVPGETPPPAKKKARKPAKKTAGDKPVKADGNQKPFSLELFPRWVLEAVDKIVIRSGQVKDVQTYLRTRWDGPLSIPAEKSIRKYLTWRRSVLFDKTDTRIEIEQIIQDTDIDLTKVDHTDRPKFLRSTITLLCQRIEHIKRLNTNLGDSKYEKIITDNLKVIRETTEAIHKMESTGVADHEVIQVVSDVLTKPMMGAFLDAYKEIHGNKKLKALGNAMDRFMAKLDFEALEREVDDTLKQKKKEIRVVTN